MLAVEIRPDGGVTITGTERDLRELASWLLRAAVNGSATPAFVADRGLSSITITRSDD
jgi:hypothetical protein